MPPQLLLNDSLYVRFNLLKTNDKFPIGFCPYFLLIRTIFRQTFNMFCLEFRRNNKKSINIGTFLINRSINSRFNSKNHRQPYFASIIMFG